MVRPDEFESPTYGVEIRCSIQLSYGRSYLYAGQNRDNDLRNEFDVCQKQIGIPLIKVSVKVHNVLLVAIYVL